MSDFIEVRIISAVRGFLAGKVNEILGEMEFSIPLVELTGYAGGSAVVPAVTLSVCERSEKERLLLVDAYSLTIAFAVPESEDSELYCYAYASAVEKALYEDVTLGGIAERTVLTGKKYKPPKHEHCGEAWEIVLSLRVVIGNAASMPIQFAKQTGGLL